MIPWHWQQRRIPAWAGVRPFYLPSSPEELVDDLFIQVQALLPMWQRFYQQEHRIIASRIISSWVPLGWMAWWYTLLPFEDRYGFLTSALRGEPLNGWRSRFIATYRGTLPYLRRRMHPTFGDGGRGRDTAHL